MGTEKEINIIALEFPDSARLRPGKLIGSTDNPNVILREAVDNAVDEAFGSNCLDSIFIRTNLPDNYCLVADNGRGIPILWDNEKMMTKTQLAVATLDAGSKFSKDLDNVAVGQNGVGISATNALSNHFIIMSKITDQNYDKSIEEVERLYNHANADDEIFYILEYRKGIKDGEGVMTRKEFIEKFKVEFPERMSTIVYFQPDETIFKDVKASYSTRNLSYIYAVLDKFYKKKITVNLNGKNMESELETYDYEIQDMISLPNYRVEGKKREAKFYITFGVSKDLSEYSQSGSVNSLIVDRGLHISAVIHAYTKALKNIYNINHDHLREGLKVNVICLCGEVDFSSQTKENCTKLDDLSMAELSDHLIKSFKQVIKAHSDVFDSHVERLNEYASSLVKISTINKIKQMVIVNNGSDTRVRSKMPSSVKDAASNDRKSCELFIVEGKSAGGTILKARDAVHQAVIELRGVPMNAIDRNLDELMDNEEMKAIISAIGVGVNEYHNMDNPHYGKIIIAADADADGGRIASLILGMIAKKMTFLIEAGYVYALNSPLYKQGDKYIYPNDDIDSLLDKSKPFKRFKGLGEISTSEAKDVITNPEKRNLIQITLENIDQALELLTSSYSRKQLMLTSGIVLDKYNLNIV